MNTKPYRRRNKNRNGNITVLTAILMLPLLAMLAFAIDLGYLQLAREELQRSADSAAMAAAWELVDEEALTGESNYDLLDADARDAAGVYASENTILRQGPSLGVSDIAVGYLSSFTDPNVAITPAVYEAPNAVTVTVRRDSAQNGRVRFFLAQLLGVEDAAAEAEATAAILTNVGGFGTPSNGGNVELLPFAMDLTTWNDLLAGNTDDDWTWDAANGQVVAGSDGILEVNLFPQGTGSPGNRGTVDVGSNNNSTADIARQIVYGISAADLAHHGGSLVFDENGELLLNGDTGISAGVKDELASIKGDPRIIPIFSQVTGPGNNAQYTIVQFAGVRIVDVKLTGKMSGKHVTIQPANLTANGGIPSSVTGTSHFVYSPVWLVR